MSEKNTDEQVATRYTQTISVQLITKRFSVMNIMRFFSFNPIEDRNESNYADYKGAVGLNVTLTGTPMFYLYR